jgi:hypothetical protein
MNMDNITSKEQISIINIAKKENTRLVDSPRTLEACKMEGIIPNELLYKQLDY